MKYMFSRIQQFCLIVQLMIYIVYPPELQLKKTTECPDALSYLDILITIDTQLHFLKKGIVFHLTLCSHIYVQTFKAGLRSVYLSTSMNGYGIQKICQISCRQSVQKHIKEEISASHDGFLSRNVCTCICS